MRSIRKVTTLLAKYNDTDTQKLLEAWKTELDGMLASVRKDTSSEAALSKSRCILFDDSILTTTTELSKSIRDALGQLASEAEIREITSLIQATLENIQSDTEEAVELSVDDPIDISDWKEGVEALAGKTEKELWTLLGLADERLPFFQEWTDPNTLIDPWSNEGQSWLNDADKGRVPLRPRWHQLVGIFRMLEHAFEGKATLLMDGVGLGKTMQAIGAIACLAYYRAHYAKKGDYPGYFGESSHSPRS